MDTLDKVKEILAELYGTGVGLTGKQVLARMSSESITAQVIEETAQQLIDYFVSKAPEKHTELEKVDSKASYHDDGYNLAIDNFLTNIRGDKG